MTGRGLIPKKLHFLGVGGMGMAPLAIGLAHAGWVISGEDDFLNLEMRRILSEAGVKILSLESLVEDYFPERVVYSSAVKEGHVAREIAEGLEIPLQRRGSFLAEFSKSKQVIAICGSHGKSTTTAMCAHLFQGSRLDADYYVGAFYQDSGKAPGKFTDASILIAEIDESDGTMLEFEPETLCILSLDWDHKDSYSSEKTYREAFYRIAERTKKCVWVPEHEVDSFSKRLNGRVIVKPLIPKPTFLEFNSSAALQILSEYDDRYVPGISDAYPKLARRQEMVYEDCGFKVMHDYAHHPEEIRALLQSLRLSFVGWRLEVYFEPHRYSRTEHLADALIQSLEGADSVCLLPIYSAGEPMESDSTDALYASAMQRRDKVTIYSCAAELFTKLREQGAQFDNTLRVFVGAGNIDFLAKSYGYFLEGRARDYGEHLQLALGKDLVNLRERLSGKTTMRVGGRAEVYVEPPDRESLREVFKITRLWDAPLFFLGKGSNLIVSDSGIPACVVRLNQEVWMGVRVSEDKGLQVGAGVRLRDICKEAERHGIGGFEFMEGIPASLGGALRMNAGAMGGWMSDVIESIEVMNEEGSIEFLGKDDLHYGYRSIHELADRIALSARLRSDAHSTSMAVKARIQENMQKRKKAQPRESSAGCIFKNPEGDHAGRLIDACGLKGFRVGDAQVSDVHANFIVNLGAANSGDIVELVRHVRATVFEQTGVLLEPEAILVGQTWQEVLA